VGTPQKGQDTPIDRNGLQRQFKNQKQREEITQK
jgi:hypothetical protein